MSNIYDGTYMWIWQADKIYGGDVQQMVTNATSLGLKGVLIKFADGSLARDSASQSYMQQFKRLVGPFKAAGFTVGGWIYQYLTDVAGEVDACAQAIQAGADWIVIDSESEINGKAAQVAQFGQRLRARFPNVTVGLSSFAIADYHSEVPYQEYAKFVDVMMPQIYWGEMGWDVGVAFQASVTSYKKIGKPIAPSGQAFGNVQPADMARFVQLCGNARFSHISWWDWQEASPSQLNAIKANRMVPSDPQPANHIARDVPDNAWYAKAVQYVLQNNLMSTNESGNFNPDQPATRAMLAQVLYNLSLKNGGGS
ncbi:S-layer homology domain-containing protein [Aneurinibacillus terranovensis]|uniref:S-layer homology domain-containing protein n=1 Tax=Aneurinibacillus terranovensis TaxID=278991 RepID=UPI0003F73BE2|nr:S-layer homology domain-containing protein [Aneurinibacillus terranovensis]